MACLNRGFVFSILGGLQVAVVVMGFLEVALLGAAMTKAASESNTYFYVIGFSFYAFLFFVAFWCFMTSTIIVLTSAISDNTASLLVKTLFYVGYHGAATFFFLVGSLALLVEAAKYERFWITYNGFNLKELVYVGGCIGCAQCVLYALITMFGLFKYRQNSI